MSADDRSPTVVTTQVVEFPDRPLVVCTCARGTGAQRSDRAYAITFRRFLITFVVGCFVAIGSVAGHFVAIASWWTPVTQIAWVAVLGIGCLWASAPVRAMRRTR